MATSDELHREADNASGNAPKISEVINPRERLARQEAQAGLTPTNTSRAPAAPAPATGGMSQTQFSKGGGTRSAPPEDMLKRHRAKY